MALAFGAQLAGNDTTWEEMKSVAETMDRGHWTSAWTFDHFVPPMPGMDESGDCLEGWTTLIGLAVSTDRLRWGCLVTGNTYRNPALLAKMAATLDQMTNGRLELGIGAAWHQREHDAYGWDFPPIGERSDRLEEACSLIHELFTADGPVDFEGRYYRLDKAPFAPKCVQQPHVPIMVAGGGERRTLRTLAMYGDTMNVLGSPDMIKHKIEVLEKHCADVGRDAAQITHTAMLPVKIEKDPKQAKKVREMYGAAFMLDADQARYLPIGSPDQIMESLRVYETIGVDGILFAGIAHESDLYEQLDKEVLAVYS